MTTRRLPLPPPVLRIPPSQLAPQIFDQTPAELTDADILRDAQQYAFSSTYYPRRIEILEERVVEAEPQSFGELAFLFIGCTVLYFILSLVL